MHSRNDELRSSHELPNMPHICWIVYARDQSKNIDCVRILAIGLHTIPSYQRSSGRIHFHLEFATTHVIRCPHPEAPAPLSWTPPVPFSTRANPAKSSPAAPRRGLPITPYNLGFIPE